MSIEQAQWGELSGWILKRAGHELWIAEQGGQILQYLVEGRPLLWLSEQAQFNAGLSVRGGVPICWPWFGDLARNPPAVQAQAKPGSAFHGLVRSLPWQLQHLEEQPEAISLTLALDTRHSPLADWPYAARLTLTLRLAQSLTLSLTNENLGSEPLAITQALHSYFAVSHIQQVKVLGLGGCRYLDTLNNWQEQTQQGALSFAGETDRVYLEVPAQLVLEDALWQRRIELTSQGSTSAVLWNPWIDKAQRLSGFAEEAWQRMLCIETANLLDDALELAPQQSHSLTLELNCRPL